MSLVPPAMSGIGPKTRRAGCRFRPLLRRTFGFRLPPTGEASSYSRPVLGAGGTLRGSCVSRNRSSKLFHAKSDLFFSSVRKGKLDLPFDLPDGLCAALNRIAEPVRVPRATADQSRAERVELEVVAV